MFALGLAVTLAAAGIASFPCWSYSARWGYGPSVAAAILLVSVGLVAAGGKPLPRMEVFPPVREAVRAAPSQRDAIAEGQCFAACPPSRVITTPLM